MTRRLFWGWLSGLVCILVLLPHDTRADIFMKHKQHLDAVTIMGQTHPAEDYPAETWITDTKMVMSDRKQKVVYDLTNRTVTFANHVHKTIITMPLDFSKKKKVPKGILSDEEQKQLQQYMDKKIDVTLTITPTSEKKKIGEWNCTKYIQTVDMSGGKETSVIWATTDIKIDKELYARFNTAMLAQIPGISQNAEDVLQAIKKIKGVYVLTETKIEVMRQSVNTSTELLEIKNVNAPDEVFKLPIGYRKQELH